MWFTFYNRKTWKSFNKHLFVWFLFSYIFKIGSGEEEKAAYVFVKASVVGVKCFSLIQHHGITFINDKKVSQRMLFRIIHRNHTNLLYHRDILNVLGCLLDKYHVTRQEIIVGEIHVNSNFIITSL